MPISGIAIRFQDRPGADREALPRLARIPGLELGRRAPDRVAAVLDTPDREADKAAFRRIEGTPGVDRIDVVYIHFEYEDLPAASGA